jgi:hypothetical protein
MLPVDTQDERSKVPMSIIISLVAFSQKRVSGDYQKAPPRMKPWPSVHTPPTQVRVLAPLLLVIITIIASDAALPNDAAFGTSSTL